MKIVSTRLSSYFSPRQLFHNVGLMYGSPSESTFHRRSIFSLGGLDPLRVFFIIFMHFLGLVQLTASTRYPSPPKRQFVKFRHRFIKICAKNGEIDEQNSTNRKACGIKFCRKNNQHLIWTNFGYEFAAAQKYANLINSCRSSRKMLKKAPTLATRGFDTSENELPKVSRE